MNGCRVGAVGKGFVEWNATNTDYEYVLETEVVTVLVAVVKELVAEATVVSMIILSVSGTFVVLVDVLA